MGAGKEFVDWSLEDARRRVFPDAEIPEGPRVCLGAGDVAPDDWVCVDRDAAYPEGDVLSVFESGSGRVRSGFLEFCRAVPDGSCAVVYAHHVVEHLPLASWEESLRAAAALLAPGGLLYMCQPDLEALAARTLEACQEGAAAAWFDADPVHRTWTGDSRAGLSLKGHGDGSVWYWLYLGGDHRSVPTSEHLRNALDGTGVDLRTVRRNLSEVGVAFRLFVALEGCYLGRKMAR